MKNKLFRKYIVIGMIVLLLFVGVYPANGNDVSISKSNNDLPDYIITKVGKGYDPCSDGTYYYIVIKNIGDKIGGWGFTIYLDEYKVNIFKPDEKYNNWCIGESGPYGLEPGESKSLEFSRGFFDEHPWLARYECNLECDFHEKNSDNNFFKKTYFSVILFFIPLPDLF